MTDVHTDAGDWSPFPGGTDGRTRMATEPRRESGGARARPGSGWSRRVSTFDAIVIGAGQAGPGVARHLAAAGRQVALVEADKVGGTCLNRGCRPTKALRASARVAHLARTAARHGVHTGDVTVDFAAVMARKDALIDGWVHGEAESLGHTDGLTLLYGEARFTGRTDSDVRDRRRRSLAHRRPGVPQRRHPRHEAIDPRARRRRRGSTTIACSTSTSCPTHLVILGGSYIGLELGQLFARFGSAVTIIEAGRADRRPRGPRHLRRDRSLPDRRRHRALHVDEGRADRADGRRRAPAHRRRANDRRFAPAGRDRANTEHRPPRPRSRRAVDRRPRLRAHRRRVPHRRRGHLGARRHQRPWRVHAHVVPGLRDPRRSPQRREPHRGRTHPDVRDVHRPAARAGRHDRVGGDERQDAR